MGQMLCKALLLSGVLAIAAAGPAVGAPVLGAQLYYAGGDVTVTSLPVSSGYLSERGLYDAGFARLLFLMNDEPPGVVVVFDPSIYGIGVGDELIFGIRVKSDGDRQYFMGPGSRNPDGIEHAGVDDLGSGVFVVGFEDLFGGGDRDFDDNRFRFEGAVRGTPGAPEPATLLLTGLGMAGLGFARRRSRSSR